MNNKDSTLIICCAGMGIRLGIGTTKALVDICGEPLIIRQLQMLDSFDDIRIVVGFQAEKLISVVKKYRADVMFAFNYEYEHTGVADSLRKALVGARENIITLDGDTLVNSDDFHLFTNYEQESLAVSSIRSTEPILATVVDNYATHLSKVEGNYQWSGIAKFKASKFIDKSKHVYDVVNRMLPMPVITIRSREVNTQDDYDEAISWFKDGCTK